MEYTVDTTTLSEILKRDLPVSMGSFDTSDQPHLLVLWALPHLEPQLLEFTNRLIAQHKGAPTGSFQERLEPWLLECFGQLVANDIRERNFRFIEEAIELSQSCGLRKEEVLKMVDYVYDRPIGEPAQEVGGVMVTLSALCLAVHIDLNECAERELARIWTKIDDIREKQVTKQVMGITAEIQDEELGDRFTVKSYEDGYRVYDEKQAVYLTQICPEEVANGICEDFNKMENRDFRPIGGLGITEQENPNYLTWLHEATTKGYEKKVIINTRHGAMFDHYYEIGMTPEQAIDEYIASTGQKLKAASTAEDSDVQKRSTKLWPIITAEWQKVLPIKFELVEKGIDAQGWYSNDRNSEWLPLTGKDFPNYDFRKNNKEVRPKALARYFVGKEATND